MNKSNQYSNTCHTYTHTHTHGRNNVNSKFIMEFQYPRDFKKPNVERRGEREHTQEQGREVIYKGFEIGVKLKSSKVINVFKS